MDPQGGHGRGEGMATVLLRATMCETVPCNPKPIKTHQFFRNGALRGTSSDSPNVLALGMDSRSYREELQENKPASTLLYSLVIS